jgi:hypothetical protein
VNVPDDIRKCVVFVGYQLANGDYEFAGSAFYIGEGLGKHAVSVALVTARHVIDGIRGLGLDKVFIRYNAKSGGSKWQSTRLEDWKYHPSDASIDVAFLRMGIPDAYDHLVLPKSVVATPELLLKNEVGLGDEVFVTGLFKHHTGAQKNVPIVRVGNIAAMQEEKVQSRAFGLIDAYLIEARSIGGISGSPVFVNLGSSRRIGGSTVFYSGGPAFLLLGLIHGHYDVDHPLVDALEVDANQGQASTAKLNSGIAIVVPVQKVLEVLDSNQVKSSLYERLAITKPSEITVTMQTLNTEGTVTIQLDGDGHLKAWAP